MKTAEQRAALARWAEPALLMALLLVTAVFLAVPGLRLHRSLGLGIDYALLWLAFCCPAFMRKEATP
jgi:hypothetical protein